jgi:hypothetical protein
VIPARAFATEEEMRQFGTMAKRYFEESRHGSSTMKISPPEWFQLPPAISKLTYHATREDVLKVLRGGGGTQKQSQTQQPPPKQSGFGIGLVLVLILLPVMLLLSQSAAATTPPDRIWTGILYLLSCLLLWVLGLFALNYFRARWHSRKINLQEEELTLTVLGCVLQSDGRISFLHWEDVGAVLQDDSVITLKLEPGSFQVIPKRAFNDPLEAEEFFQRCHEYWTAIHAGPANPVPLSAVVVETGNPYQSPRQI